MNLNRSATGNAPGVLHVAIVGAGPAGFHAAIALLEQSDRQVEVDLFDRLPTPYGLVRAGVAPDHQKIKSITRLYEKLGTDPRFAFLGNVELGRDIEVSDLTACYDQVLFATGNESDRSLGIPGEHLTGAAPASAFVGWYNGHPDCRDSKFSLSSQRVAIIGNGNVALDVARMLLKSPTDLQYTDMAEHALTALMRSQVREIVIIGRRGPLQATFTPPELRELIEMEDVSAQSVESELSLDEPARTALAAMGAKHPPRRVYELLSSTVQPRATKAQRTLRFRFLQSPVEFIGDAQGQLQQIRLQRNRLVVDAAGRVDAVGTDAFETLEVGAAFIAIGHESRRIPGLAFDESRGIVANIEGRVIDPDTQEWRPREYCTGWARTGAKGLIATQKVGSAEVVARMLADYEQGRLPAEPRQGRTRMRAFLEQRQIRQVSFGDWKTIDSVEVQRGQARGALRSKIVDVPEMMELVELKRLVP